MKTKIDIFSGFLGAGKTTLIRKLIKEAYSDQKIVIIENEFGEIGIDGDFLKDAGIEIKEMSQGCICCSLVGDFTTALKKVIEEMQPERIIIEPSGVGKLSDVIKAVQNVDSDDIELSSFTTICDGKKVEMYAKNFGEFYNDQIEHANCIVISRSQALSEEKLDAIVKMIREKNSVATIITTPWDDISGEKIVETMEHKDTLNTELEKLKEEVEHEHHHHDEDEDDDHECCCHHHHDEDEDDDHECCCHHHHDEDEDDDHECCCHHHHDEDEDDDHECCCHHHHDEDEDDDHECCCHHHHDEDEDDDHECCCHHHHDEDEDDDHECCCHHHHDEDEEHEHHHHHHADEIFTSWGKETNHKYSKEEIANILKQLDDQDKYGIVLRAKGIVEGKDGKWIYFDYVPEETDIRDGNAIAMGRFCVIGSKMDQEAIEKLFGNKE